MDLKNYSEKLGICPFDLFRQAHALWFQAGPDDELVGRYFEAYIGEGIVPQWVRLYVDTLAKRALAFPRATIQAVA